MLFLVVLIIGCNGNSPEKISLSAINCDQVDNLKSLGVTSDEIMMVGDNLFSGECFTYAGNSSNIAEIRRYKDGVRHGKWVMFYENGNVFYIGTANNGVIDGPYTSYYDNGQIQDKGKLSKGFRHGLWIIYNIDGTVRSKTYYEKGNIVRTKNFN